MKCTKKSVNAALERRDYLRRIYRVQGDPDMGVFRPLTLGRSVACYGDDGQCQMICFFSISDLERARRSHGAVHVAEICPERVLGTCRVCYHGAVDVTWIIDRWLIGYNYTRAQAVADIADTITEDMA